MSTKRVLIAEDDSDLRALFAMLLQQEQYEVQDAADGQQVLTRLEAQVPDLLILDINMPKLSGLEVLKHLRQKPETRAMKIIVLTANAIAAANSPEIQYADMTLLKPVGVADLIRLVERLLAD
jgi:CheY-like chemotaxis protein